jgi:hypothetical protein
MSILKKIGRFFGKAVKKIGNVVGAVAKPLSAIAAPLKPLMMLNPITRGVSMGLDVASGVADAASKVGGGLIKATMGTPQIPS